MNLQAVSSAVHDAIDRAANPTPRSYSRNERRIWKKQHQPHGRLKVAQHPIRAVPAPFYITPGERVCRACSANRFPKRNARYMPHFDTVVLLDRAIVQGVVDALDGHPGYVLTPSVRVEQGVACPNLCPRCDAPTFDLATGLVEIRDRRELGLIKPL